MPFRKLFCLLSLILILTTAFAGQKERPAFSLGGALRFNYNFSDWKPGHRDRWGDFGYDVLFFHLSASYKKFLLDADYRFYAKEFGGPMLKYGWIGYQFNPLCRLEVGLTRVPFGIQPFGAHNFFFQISYYVGLEDDSDMGVKFVYQGERWEYNLAFFKNADEMLFGSDNEVTDDRYGYDVAGRNKEINQGNAQVFYKFGNTIARKIGVSAEFGQLYNLDTRKNGTHFAFAVHYELAGRGVSLKTQVTTYAMYPANAPGEDRNVITMTAYGAPYLVASKANIYSAGLGYTIPVRWGPLSAIQIYNDFGWLQKWKHGFNDSFQNVTGCMLSIQPVFVYIDYALGKHHGWLGTDWDGFGPGAGSNSWHARLNINIGYYF